MRVVFFGTPQFAADVLTFLLNKGVEVVGVITKPDKPKGRSGALLPTPVKQIAELNQIPYFQPAVVSSLEFAEQIQAFHADLFVVVAYGEILKQHLLDMPKLGCINLHASLLPKYRGAAPIQRAIMNGEEKTGVTIMHMVKKMDAGDMIKIVEVPISEEAMFSEIEAKLCQQGSDALYKVLQDFEKRKAKIEGEPQNHEQATLAPKIELIDCEIKWEYPAKKIHDLIRAVSPEPGAWCYLNIRGQKKRLKILKSKRNTSMAGMPGQILAYGKQGFIIGCGFEALECLVLQIEGKSPMQAADFMRGIPQDVLHF